MITTIDSRKSSGNENEIMNYFTRTHSESAVSTSPERIFQIFMCLVVITLWAYMVQPAWSQTRMVDAGELSIENAEVSMRLTTANKGSVTVRCIDCGANSESIRLKLDKNSKAYINGEPVSFLDASKISEGIKSVNYDPENRKLASLLILTNL